MKMNIAWLLLAAMSAFSNDQKIHPDLLREMNENENSTAAMFVVFAERPDLSAARSMSREERGRFVVQALTQTANRSQNGVQGLLRGRRVAFESFWVENKIYIPAGSLDLARDLARLPQVAALLPDESFPVPSPEVRTANATAAVQWNISRIGADQVWTSNGTRGEGMVVASIDTGVQHTHPALVNQYRGLNANGTYNHAGSWRDPTGVCGSTPCDNNGHGTHTVGTMVGSDGGSNQIGVAPGAKWIACKGCGTSSCSSSALTSCAQWIMDPFNNGSGNGRPDVVNNSWGGSGGQSWYQSYVNNWRAAGIFPAFSNGNSGPNCQTSGSPGDYPVSFSSGASDSSDNIASFSSRGPSLFNGVVKPDITAPGVSIRSSVPTNSYSSYNGTSMASPHTAGAVALLWAAQPSLRGQISESESLFRLGSVGKTTTQNCGGVSGSAVPNNTFGFGILNVKESILRAGGPVNVAPVVSITSPANGSTFDCGTSITFMATASDSEDGNISSSILWSLGGQSAGPGASVSRSFSCSSETGFRNISAQAQDSAGAIDTDSITINIVDPNVINAPSNLTASVSSRTVNLGWRDNSTNETEFRIERRTKTRNTFSSWTQIGTVSANTTSYSNSPGKGEYQYRVRAASSTQVSNYSNSVQAKVN